MAPVAISVEFRKSRRSIGASKPRGSEEESGLPMTEVFSTYDKPFRLAGSGALVARQLESIRSEPIYRLNEAVTTTVCPWNVLHAPYSHNALTPTLMPCGAERFMVKPAPSIEYLSASRMAD